MIVILVMDRGDGQDQYYMCPAPDVDAKKFVF
jgi:hypothetical protein